MQGQVEGAVVDRQQPLAAQVQVRLQRLFRLHVHERPARIVGAGLDHGQVERAVLLADGLEAVEVAGVAAEEDAEVVVLDHPRRPQAAVAVAQAAAGEVLARGGGQAQAAGLGRLPPVQLFDLAGVHTPGDQLVADAERCNEARGLASQLHYRGMVEMVIVVVREDHAGDGRQFVDADRRCVEARRAHPLHRRGALGEHRIGQPVLAAQLQQDRGVPQPEQTAVRRSVEGSAVQRLHRNGVGRDGALGLVEQERPPDLRTVAQAHRRTGQGIAELAITVLRRIGEVGEGPGHAEGVGGHGEDSKQEDKEQALHG